MSCNLYKKEQYFGIVLLVSSIKFFINVFLFSDHLIQKRHIYSMEGMIKDQLFARVPVRVTIFEHFQLSEQYTPENLMREYYDSLMLEAAQRSVVESNMLKTAESIR